MASYLCVKTNNSVKSYTVKSSANKPYIRVSTGYLPLTMETTSAPGLRIKSGSDVYRVVETYSTSCQITTTTSTSYNTRASTYSTTYGTRSSTSETGYLTRSSTSTTGYLTRASTSQTGYLTKIDSTGYLTRKSTSQTGYLTRSSKYYTTVTRNPGVGGSQYMYAYAYFTDKYSVSTAAAYTMTDKETMSVNISLSGVPGGMGVKSFAGKFNGGEFGLGTSVSATYGANTYGGLNMGTQTQSKSDYYRKSDGITLSDVTKTSARFGTQSFSRLSYTYNYMNTSYYISSNTYSSADYTKSESRIIYPNVTPRGSTLYVKINNTKSAAAGSTRTYGVTGYVDYYVCYSVATHSSIKESYSLSRASTSSTTYGTRASTSATTYRTVTTATTYGTRASTSSTTYGTRASISATTYGTRSSTYETGYLTRSSTYETIYLTTTSSSSTSTE